MLPQKLFLAILLPTFSILFGLFFKFGSFSTEAVPYAFSGKLWTQQNESSFPISKDAPLPVSDLPLETSLPAENGLPVGDSTKNLRQAPLDSFGLPKQTGNFYDEEHSQIESQNSSKSLNNEYEDINSSPRDINANIQGQYANAGQGDSRGFTKEENEILEKLDDIVGWSENESEPDNQDENTVVSDKSKETVYDDHYELQNKGVFGVSDVTDKPSSHENTVSKEEHQKRHRSNEEVQNDRLIIYRRAYLDRRTNDLILFVFDRCPTVTIHVEFSWQDPKTDTVYGPFNSVGINSKTDNVYRPFNSVGINSRPRCRSKWSPGCRFQNHIISIDLEPEQYSSHEKRSLRELELVNLKLRTGTNPPTSLKEIVEIPYRFGENETFPHSLGICVPSLYLYVDWVQMVQFFETWKLLGATKIWLYITSISVETDTLLQKYVDSGLVERVIWPWLPEAPDDESSPSVYRYGMQNGINECVYRSIGQAKYVAVIDFDEYIFPHPRFTDIPEMLETYKGSEQRTAAFLFRHQAIRFQEPLPEAINLESFKFDYLANIQLEERRGPSKLIVKPNKVREIYSHRVGKYLNQEEKKLRRTPAKLYHLRKVPSKKKKGRGLKPQILKGSFEKFVPFISRITENFRSVVFPNTLPNTLKTHEDLLMRIGLCSQTWNRKRGKCKIPDKQCFSVIEGIPDYENVFRTYKSSPDSSYTGFAYI